MNVVVSGQITTGTAGANHGSTPYMFAFAPGVDFQDFTAWGIRPPVRFNGVTLGGSYTDQGRYGTTHGQNRDQNTWSLGAKYEFDKVGVAVNYLAAQGYDNLLACRPRARRQPTATTM